MSKITERQVTLYIVDCKQGEAQFEKREYAEAFIKLQELAEPLTAEQFDNAVKATPEQVAAWCVVGSCPNCGANSGDGDLELEHLDGESYAAECYVCGTKFDIIEGKSEVIY